MKISYFKTVYTDNSGYIIQLKLQKVNKLPLFTSTLSNSGHASKSILYASNHTKKNSHLRYQKNETNLLVNGSWP